MVRKRSFDKKLFLLRFFNCRLFWWFASWFFLQIFIRLVWSDWEALCKYPKQSILWRKFQHKFCLYFARKYLYFSRKLNSPGLKHVCYCNLFFRQSLLCLAFIESLKGIKFLFQIGLQSLLGTPDFFVYLVYQD